MTLPKSERAPAKIMLKMIRDHVERLLETSPAVPRHIINKYKETFKNSTDVSHPEITNGIHKLEINTVDDTVVNVPVIQEKSNIKVSLVV